MIKNILIGLATIVVGVAIFLITSVGLSMFYTTFEAQIYLTFKYIAIAIGIFTILFFAYMIGTEVMEQIDSRRLYRSSDEFYVKKLYKYMKAYSSLARSKNTLEFTEDDECYKTGIKYHTYFHVKFNNNGLFVQCVAMSKNRTIKVETIFIEFEVNESISDFQDRFFKKLTSWRYEVTNLLKDIDK